MKVSYLTPIVFISLGLINIPAQKPRTPEKLMDRGLERQSKGARPGSGIQQPGQCSPRQK